jgi:cell shape-determining protein MreD
MRSLLRAPLAMLSALVLVALSASITRQLSGGAVSLALAVPVIVWLGIETPVVEGVIGAALVGVVLDAAAGGPGGLLTFLSVGILLGVRAGAGAFDARSRLGFALLSGVATFAMGFGAILLTRYVAPPNAEPGWALLGRVLVESLLTAAAAPAIRWALDRVVVPAHRDQPGFLR